MSWHIGIASGACTHRSILEILPLIHAAGVSGVEIGTPPRHFDPTQPDQVRAARRALDALSLTAVSIHAPFGPSHDLAHPDPRLRRAGIDAVLTTAAAIKQLGGSLVVVHPSDLERHGHDVDAQLANSAASLAVVAEGCRQEGVTLVVESPLPHLVGGHPDEFRWLLQRLDGAVRVCLDTGHTFLGGHWHAFLDIANGRLAHVHANDNHGQRDDHLPPGDGRINWAEIARTLTAVNFTGWAMLELHCSTGDPGGYFRRALTQSRPLMGL
jgi:sugar phosphate isomerase/epimerase